jgi:hypothetical protein
MPKTTGTTSQIPLPNDELVPGGAMRFEGTPKGLQAAAERLDPHAHTPALSDACRWTRLPRRVPPDPRLERTTLVWLHYLMQGTAAERDGWYLLTSASGADSNETHLRDCEPAIRIVRDALARRVRETAGFLSEYGEDLNETTIEDRLCLLQTACDERRAWLDG